MDLACVLIVSLCIWQARGKVSELINNAIVHYRDDLDLQNLIDFGQKKVPAKHGVVIQYPGGWGGGRGGEVEEVDRG